MKENELLSKVDHTYLKPDASEKDIIKLCDEAIFFNTASVCIPPSYVKMASEYIKAKKSGRQFPAGRFSYFSSKL